MTSTTQFGLFAKYWQPGQVKTRLAAKIGDQLACEIYWLFLSHLIGELQEVADDRSLVYQPAESESQFAWLNAEFGQGRWRLEPQSAGGLGDKLWAFFQTRFRALDCGPKAPRGKVLVIGSDCPRLNATQIQLAFERLDTHDVVIGPSTDGGYYLLGLAGGVQNIFEDIGWSTSSVLEQTLQRIKEKNLTFAMLDPMTDIDEYADLLSLWQQLDEDQRCHRITDSDQRLWFRLHGPAQRFGGK